MKRSGGVYGNSGADSVFRDDFDGNLYEKIDQPLYDGQLWTPGSADLSFFSSPVGSGTPPRHEAETNSWCANQLPAPQTFVIRGLSILAGDADADALIGAVIQLQILSKVYLTLAPAIVAWKPFSRGELSLDHEVPNSAPAWLLECPLLIGKQNYFAVAMKFNPSRVPALANRSRLITVMLHGKLNRPLV